MSISLLRLRRTTLSFSSIFLNKPISSLSSTPPLTPFNPTPITSSVVSQFRAFRASTISLARIRNSYQNDNDDFKIGPDDILFEGCDYNHWLITIDFPKEPRPSSEDKVETYVKTAAMIFGSVEEAKKKIYACSTTTYDGFQVECSEETSKKFEGLPRVVFILPDSYIDPINKQYGGDKYDNGIITPRPPPTQHGRTGGRFGDRNRDFNRPMRPRGEFNQGNPAYDNRGHTQGNAGNFGPSRQPPPQQNYGTPRVAPVNNSSGGQEINQGYGYVQPGAYAGQTPQYNASQPQYPGYPQQPSSGGYATAVGQQGYNSSQQPSPNPSYPPPAQPGYGAPPNSQTGYGTQPSAGYGPSYGAPQAQRPASGQPAYGQPQQSPTAQGGYAQPAPVHPGYSHSQPPSGYGAPPASGYAAAPLPYGAAQQETQPSYGGQQPPYNSSYASSYNPPPAYSADGNAAPASQTVPPNAAAKASSQS